jgi:type IV pilus assembly protein PilA
MGAATDIQGKYVSSIEVTDGGVEVTYGHEANATNLVGKTVSLIPGASANGDIIWKCGFAIDPSGWVLSASSTAASTTVAGKYLPSSCRP